MEPQENQDVVKVKNGLGRVESFVAIFATVISLWGVIEFPTSQTIEITKCDKTIETHVGKDVYLYTIDIEPPQRRG